MSNAKVDRVARAGSAERARATIVMMVRERHALAREAIESILAHTARPYRFIYVDVQSPEWLREWLAQHSAGLGVEVVRFDEPLWPQEARRRVAGMLDTDYVVFIDNDVLVEDGWLESLVACADETGAGIVGPLYLMTGGNRPTLIHMAGGTLAETAAEGGRVLVATHLLDHVDPAKQDCALIRQPCDFVEYHCMMIRSELLRDGRLLDPRMLSVHEHIDTALSARERGFSVFVEPAARVAYQAFAPYMLDDLPLFRSRWAVEPAEASIDAFSRKWGVLNDDRSFGIMRTFVRGHVSQVDPMRGDALARPDLKLAMRRDELKQTRSDLLDFALERGYAPPQVTWLASCYQVAQILTDGGYRPCGRPFINHLAGTASVLVRYGFRIEIVGAGLLHAAYTHSPPHRSGPKATADYVCAALGGKGNDLERRVRAYSKRASLHCESLQALSVADAEVLAMSAANEVDMHLSGEFRYSGRTDALPGNTTELIAQVCRLLGVDGLAESLRQAQRESTEVKPELRTGVPFSYRVAADKRSLVRMIGDDLSVLE